MYNRYIPQSDGTYRRNRVSEPIREQPRPASPKPVPPEEPCESMQEPPPCKHGQPCTRMHSQPRPTQPKHPHQGVGSFFKQLLPRDFDTEDLLIILLLLLMAGDCPEDQNTALLTLALYLFL